MVATFGEQQVPRDVKRVRIAENVDTIPAWKFDSCTQLIEVEGHNKLKKIEERAFCGCRRLRRATKMTDVIDIEDDVFYNCDALSDVDFDKLEIIGYCAFAFCVSLRSVNMPSIRSVGACAFQNCEALTDVVFGEGLERFEEYAFFRSRLRHITIPLKDNLVFDNNTFYNCGNLVRVDTLDGEIHKTVSSLHMESWRGEMKEEIDRINQTLPNVRANETARAIQQWITRVFSRMEHYRNEHQTLLKEAMALLELALWKAKLLNKTDDEKRCTVDEVTKKEHRVTCGASIVIKNVLPFLVLK